MNPLCFKNIYKKFVLSLKFPVFLLFVLNLILVFPVFFPNLNEIGPWDESIYINSGRSLIEDGVLQQFAWNPLLSFLYALVYIPVRSTTFWLIHSCTIARFVLFALMWMSACLVAKQLSRVTPPLIMIGLLLISPALIYLLPNPSDALFTAMSAFALGEVLAFSNEKKIFHAGLASFFLGLASLSRNDGLILFAIFLFLLIILSLKTRKAKKALLAGICPFLIITGGYFILYGLKTGEFKTGIAQRTYLAFEQGQGFLFEKSPSDGILEARRLFGSPEENRYSFLVAIKKNPDAYFKRFIQIIKSSPSKIYFMYGERAGIIILLLAFMGAVEMARKRFFSPLLILLLWLSHISIYILTFFRHTYFLLPYFVIFVFTSVSLNFILYHLNKKRLIFWTALLSALAILGTITNRPNLFSSALIFLTGLWFMKLVLNQYQSYERIRIIAILLTFSILFILRSGSPLPRFRKLGIAPDEKAVLFMKRYFQPGSLVFAEAPGPIWTARMNFEPLDFRFRDEDEQGILSCLNYFNGKAVYIDERLKIFEPDLIKKLENLVGKGLEIGFRSDDGKVMILLVSNGNSIK